VTWPWKELYESLTNESSCPEVGLIVLTSDSRQTYRNNAGVIRIGSDSAMKIFKLTSNCGVAISGLAFLHRNSQPPKDVGFFINQFINSEKLQDITTKEVAEKLTKYLADIFIDREIEALKNRSRQRSIKLEV